MSTRDPETGRFRSASEGARKLEHPALRPTARPKSAGTKQRRTIVRTIKLVNARNDPPVLVEVPIEPGHNNRGTLSDPTIPVRHYLEKGFVLPHEFDGEVVVAGKRIDLNQIFCAISGCWRRATITDDPEGTERCVEHEAMWRTGELRYATAAKP